MINKIIGDYKIFVSKDRTLHLFYKGKVLMTINNCTRYDYEYFVDYCLKGGVINA